MRHAQLTADLTVAEHDCLLASDHHVGGSLDAVYRALPAAVQIQKRVSPFRFAQSLPAILLKRK